MTVKELRAELAQRNLDTTGLKAALVARLEEADGSTAAAAGATASLDGPQQGDKGKRKAAAAAKDEEAAKPGRASKRGKNKEPEPEPEPEPEEEEEEEERMVTATKKGRAVLDKHLPDHVQRSHHVLSDGEEVFDCMLNQTNVGANNNKFYVIQVLESDSGKSYSVWTRWGRVGVPGQNKLQSGYDKEGAIREFEKKFFEKTKNYWSARHDFAAVPGKYTWLEMDYDGPEDEQDEKLKALSEKDKGKSKAPVKSAESKLDSRVRELIELICNLDMMSQQMVEIGYDARKMPLGKLSKKTIMRGYEVLKKISAAMESKQNNKLAELSSEFYTVIPHDFGFKKMSDYVIKSPAMLKKKLEMVEALAEIELATKLLGGDGEASDVHPADQNYDRLNCDLEPVDDDSEEAKMLRKYVQNTHGHTHSGYKLVVEQIFKVRRQSEEERYKPYSDNHNRMLLWHGSRLTNWTGILSQGLRIAPPEAPVTGYMFGKGIYFADMVSKSANYCFTSATNPTGILALAEVALGDMYELLEANYEAGDMLENGQMSTKGIGKTAPDPAQDVLLPNGAKVPLGTPKNTTNGRSYLQYNEFIVYKEAQACMRYLLKVKFQYTYGSSY
ncbi:poly(ADP-ribose) polymerase 1 [Klebsormidium nitens]|uniref:Poly [ADP-ribose] polymerase n=1 Tax=Klebsormidium nitens TaxID=105231 RepID=A0A1Y1I8A0_KLENI|nr:poly(ADP-ribose) polymerase 1 [Klebsormidium nitens]|eukprot:GAQ87205.1 poly(ADP-ribose) polymerase 1 [Klebsormidium nitens]